MTRTLFILVLIVYFLAACAEVRHKSSPLPPLISGLTGNRSQKSIEFNQRIKRKFPLGSSVSSLKVELTRNEFSIAPRSAWSGESHFDHWAARNGNNIKGPCSEVWTISWNEKLDKITDIAGSFGLMCIGC